MDASFVKVIPFLLPTHGVFSDGKCLRINTFLLKGCILQAPLYVKYPAGTKETDMDTVVGEEPLFSKHFIRPIIFNAWTNKWVLLCTRFTGRAGACQGPAHNIDLGALRPHPISRALTWGSGPCRACPAPADAQALRLRTPGRMEEGQGGQDGTLPPAPPSGT